MAADKLNLTWGDTVVVDKSAPKKFRPLEIGSICGMRLVDTQELSKEFCSPLGTTLYLVEFPSGLSMEIPEYFLLRYSK